MNECKIYLIKVITAVPAMVRVEVEKTPFKKIICCLMFPPNYPNSPILIELKSKTLADKLLAGLTKVSVTHVKNIKLFQVLRFEVLKAQYILLPE